MPTGIVKWLVTSGYISNEDKEVVQYGLEQGMYSLSGIIVTLITGYFLNVFSQSIIFLVAFIPLRIFVGGYHASTRKRCTIISAILMFSILIWLRLWNLSKEQTLILGIIECTFLFFTIPVDGQLQLEPIERKIYKKKGRIILLIEIAIFIGTQNVFNNIFSQSLMAVFSVLLCLAIGGLIKNKIISS